MEIDYRYECVSGLSSDRLFAIGVRYDAEHDHHSCSESWCVHITAQLTSPSKGDATRYTGLWQAPDGSVFISHPGGYVLQSPDPTSEPANWISHTLDASLSGLWGLRSDHVLAWGGYDEKLFHWDGAQWSQLRFPGGWIRAVHGERSDRLFAVGNAGLAMYWDGTTWTRIPYSDTTLSSVVVAQDGETVFAAGPGGELVAGAKHGLSGVLRHDSPILSLAWWREELWVGAGDGLHKLVDGKLELIKANIVAHSLDGRGDLVIGTDDFAAFTNDGVNFTGFSVKGFGKSRAGSATLWAPDLPIPIDVDHGF